MNMMKTNPTNFLDAKSADLLREAEHAAPRLPKKRKQIKGDIVRGFLTIGKALHRIRAKFSSTREYGRFLKANAPGIMTLDSSTRSDCLWLFRAANGLIDESSRDFVCSKTRSDLNCTHPSAIRRQYRASKASKIN